MTKHSVKVGDFLAYTMVTDTIIYEVVAVTEHTIKIRLTEDGPNHWKGDETNGYPIVYTQQVSNPRSQTVTKRANKDGRFRATPSRMFYPAPMHEGVPVRKVDYSF